MLGTMCNGKKTFRWLEFSQSKIPNFYWIVLIKQAKISQLSFEIAAKAEWQPLPTAADLVPPSPPHPPKDDSTRRYTIVLQDHPRGPISRFPTIAKSPVDFRMYDAIPAAQQSLSTDDSSEVGKFLPMLNDYLKSEPQTLPNSGQLLTKG
jgi:hypothetical protein